MQRRTFLKTVASSTLMAGPARTVWGFLPDDHPYMKSIGLQLWTVRNQLEADAAGTLKAVADAGYRQIELMRTLDADKYLPVARDLGLDVTSAFFDWQSIGIPKKGPSFDSIVEKADGIGLKYLVFGYIGKGHRETADQFKRHAENANKAARSAARRGFSSATTITPSSSRLWTVIAPDGTCSSKDSITTW